MFRVSPEVHRHRIALAAQLAGKRVTQCAEEVLARRPADTGRGRGRRGPATTPSFHEFMQSEAGTRRELNGHLYRPGGLGPFVHNMLTRDEGEVRDFDQLRTHSISDRKA